MNKTYRIKYNQHTGVYVAVAEISTARGKSGGSGRLVAAALLASGLSMAVFSPEAVASVVWGDQGVSASGVTEGVALGPYDCKNPASSQTVTDANGNPFVKSYPAGSSHEGAWLEGNRGVVLGGGCDNIAVAMQDAVAIGNGAAASVNAVAIGNMALANGHASVAMGYGAQALNVEAVAIGTQAQATGYAALAMGKNAKADGFFSVAIGNEAHVIDDGVLHSGNYGVAIGDNAKTQSNGIAIGSGAGTFSDQVDPITNAVTKTYVTTNQIAIGTAAGAYQQGEENISLGFAAGSFIEGNRNFHVGGNAGAGSTGDDNMAIGQQADLPSS